MIKLYHYSNKDFKGYIKPSFFGENSFTNNSQKVSGVKRSYFYLNDNEREYFFDGARYRYIAEVNKKDLYNLDNYKSGGEELSITEILHFIKRQGFKGYYKNNVACLFYAVKIKECKTLTTA